MKKEWFEPGPDGKSQFEREYYNHRESGGNTGQSISAAFRALLAGDEQQNIRDAELFEQQAINDSPPAHNPPALQVGDVVRLERYESNPNGLSWFESEAHLIGTEEKISGIYEDGTVWLSVNTCWPVSALTLIRRAGEAAPVDKDAEIAELRESLERTKLALNTTREQRDQFWSQRDAARAEVDRLQGELSYCNDMNRVLTAERDALRARIDAGVRAWEKWKQQCGSLWLWAFPGATASQAWSDVCDALDADYVVYPIAEADERKGERRKVIPARIRHDGFDYSMDYDTPWMTNRRKYDRRRTAGTIADRGKA